MSGSKSFLVLNLALIIAIMSTSIAYIGILGVIHSLLELFAFIVIPSIAATIIYQQWKKNIFTIAEFLAISATHILFLIPAIMLISLSILPYQFVAYPLLAIALLSCFVIYKGKFPKITITIYDVWLIIGLFVLGIVIWLITHAYYPLPDFDPYYWLSRYQSITTSYQSGIFSIGGRPGFFSLFFLYNSIANIDAYAIFKYVFPFLYILPVFPLWMIAKKMKHPLASAAILMTLVWSASTLLYALTSMPQMICISAFFFFIAFLLYARITHDLFYLALSMGVLVLSLPSYELAIVPLIVMVTCILWKWRKSIIASSKANPIITILGMLLVITNLHYISNQIFFFIFWVLRIFSQIFSININLLFPAHYINVDGNSVGWSGVTGIIQYYAYYVGIPTIIIFAVCISFICIKKWRIRVLHELQHNVEAQIALLTFLVFFSISEIFPRVLNLALLPERTWIFGGIMLVYPAALILYSSHPKISKKIAFVLLVGSIVSIYGALYVNRQKVNLIPEYQLASASWVQENLPRNRIMISDENSNLLAFFSSSKTATMLPLYCNTAFSDPKALLKALDASGISGKVLKHVYVFYAQTDPGNPYKVRPYVKPRESCSPFVFDAHPESYHRVYSNNDRVIIWEVK